jgi:hypothetical protein
MKWPVTCGFTSLRFPSIPLVPCQLWPQCGPTQSRFGRTGGSGGIASTAFLVLEVIRVNEIAGPLPQSFDVVVPAPPPVRLSSHRHRRIGGTIGSTQS